jgi:methionine synthase II (cobalamin-independent)
MRTKGQVFEDVKVPDGKVLIPGVVDSTNNYIEHPDLIAQRIVRNARLVGSGNVLAGDCGCGSFGSLASRPRNSSGRSSRLWRRALG